MFLQRTIAMTRDGFHVGGAVNDQASRSRASDCNECGILRDALKGDDLSSHFHRRNTKRRRPQLLRMGEASAMNAPRTTMATAIEFRSCSIFPPL